MAAPALSEMWSADEPGSTPGSEDGVTTSVLSFPSSVSDWAARRPLAPAAGGRPLIGGQTGAAIVARGGRGRGGRRARWRRVAGDQTGAVDCWRPAAAVPPAIGGRAAPSIAARGGRGRGGAPGAPRSNACRPPAHARIAPPLPQTHVNATGKRKRGSAAERPPRAPAAPSRPARASAAPLRAHLRATLASWSASLTALQPKCVVAEGALERGVSLALAFARRCPAGPLPPASLAGAFWVAVKADGTRCSVPSRGLLARATGVAPAALSAAEVELLVAVAFDVYAGDVGRAGGVAA